MNKIDKITKLILFICLNIINLICTLIYFQYIEVTDWQKLILIVILTIIITMMFVKKEKFPINSILYIIYTMLSLYGLVALLPIFPEIKNIRSSFTMDFLNYKELSKAISLGTIGIINFVNAILLFLKVNKNEDGATIFGSGFKNFKDDDSNNIIGAFSIIILSISLIYFLYYIIMHNNFIFDYKARIMQSYDNVLSHFTIFMSFAFVLLISVGNKKQIKMGLPLFLGISIINFILGNRGEVYYPVFAAIAAYNKRKGTFKLKSVIAITLISLILFSFIRIARNSINQSTNYGEIIYNISPISAISEAFGEMGFQIGTITYTLRYLDESNDFQYGKTYIYSINTFLARYIPFIEQPNTDDPASIVSIMPSNGYGYTNIGEAYFNFGYIGVIMYDIVMAYYLLKSSRKSKNYYVDLFNNLFFVEIIAWIRNSSSTFPVYFAWSVVFIIIVGIINLSSNKGKRIINEK